MARASASTLDSPRKRWYRGGPGERWWFAAVLIPGALTAVVVATQGSSIESDLQTRVEASLEAAGMTGVEVEMSGRSVHLTVPTGQNEEKAVDTASAVEGVGAVDAERVAASAAEARACEDLQAKIDKVTETRGVLFPGGSASLSGTAASQVSAIAKLLVKCPSVAVTVDGHADASVLDKSAVSLRRAEAVRGALTRGGVKSSRIETNGYGDTFPIARDDTAAARAANNRVVITVAED
jgi:outer membrane protein OmpA-like peptidoglycan-associated protein